MTDDEAAAFCHRLRPRLVGALGLHLGDRGIAEELAQEALARAWARWARIRRLDRPDAWAFRVAFNLARSHWRRRGAERRASERARNWRSEPSGTDTASVLVVREAVAALPERQRRALVCRYYVQFTVAETAEVMACAEGTVKSLTHRALASLRERVEIDEPEEETDAGRA